MKKLFLVVILIMITTNLQAQKIYLSGIYNNGYIQYLNNGKYQKAQLNLNDFTYDNNTEIVIYGEFKMDEEGNSFFNIEREDQAVQLVSGVYLKKKYKCPGSPDEGQITLANGNKTFFTSFVPLNAEGNLSVTKADWGIKVCDNKIYSMYYIHKINTGGASQQQVINSPKPKPKTNETTVNPMSTGNIGSRVSAQEAKDALDFHNKVRADVGVAPLTWSPELSKYAQEWADYLANNGCQFKHRDGSNQNGKSYGENIGMGYSGYNALAATKNWYSEISKFQNVVLDNTNWYAAGHYTQMVWRKTTQVGIGAAKCTNGANIIVANYNPPGNYMGQKAY